MASRWRRRPLCLLAADGESPAALRHVSGRGAFVQTNARPPIGTPVTLHHPEAGAIAARVIGLQADGVALRFDAGGRSVAWALSAIAADMSRPSRG